MIGSCKGEPAVVTPSLCLCYLVVSNKLKVKKKKLVLNACKQAGSKKAIRSLSFTCKSFVNTKGKVKKAKFIKTLIAINNKCFAGTQIIGIM